MRPRRERRSHEPANHDRWLLSYSDFITLLFAFFVVLFASSYRDKQTIQKLSQAIHMGFQQLGAFSGGQANRGAAYPNLTPAPSIDTQQAQHTESDTGDASPASSFDVVELRQQHLPGYQIARRTASVRPRSVAFCVVRGSTDGAIFTLVHPCNDTNMPPRVPSFISTARA